MKVLVIHTLGSAWCEYNPVSKNLSRFDYSEFFQKLTDKVILLEGLTNMKPLCEAYVVK